MKRLMSFVGRLGRRLHYHVWVRLRYIQIAGGSPANEGIAFYDPGADITGHTSAAVTGKRFVMISGNRQTKTTLTSPQIGTSDPAGGGNVQVAHATAAGRIFGVASHDAAIGTKVNIMRPPKVVPVRAVAAIAAFEEVEVGATGQATPKAAGVAVGYALTAAAINTDAEIHIYG